MELENRRRLGNPPFGYVALVRVHGPQAGRVAQRAHGLGAFLRQGIAKIGNVGTRGVEFVGTGRVSDSSYQPTLPLAVVAAVTGTCPIAVALGSPPI